jgi:hypothetical protein
MWSFFCGTATGRVSHDVGSCRFVGNGLRKALRKTGEAGSEGAARAEQGKREPFEMTQERVWGVQGEMKGRRR